VILDGDTLHLIHNHSVSSERCSLTVDRRKRICTTLWHYVADKSSAAQPAVLFGGDFNCSLFEWTLCFSELLGTQSARRTVQICRSRSEGGHKGDNAIAINVRAVQETSGFGRSWQSKKEAFSDGHDVVLVPIQWGNGRESKNSAAQPVSVRVRVEQFEAKATKRSSSNVDPDAVALFLMAQWHSEAFSSVREVPMGKLLDRVCQVVRDTAVSCDNKNLAKGDQAEQYIHNLGIDAGLCAKTELIKLQFKFWAGTDEAMYYGYWIAAQNFLESAQTPSTPKQPQHSKAGIPTAAAETEETLVPPNYTTGEVADAEIYSILVATADPLHVTDNQWQGVAGNGEPTEGTSRMGAPVSRGPVIGCHTPIRTRRWQAVLPVRDESDEADYDHPGPDSQIDWADIDEDCMFEAPSLSLPSPETPLYSALFGKLSVEGDEGLIESLADMFLYGSLQRKQPYGSAGQPARSPNDPYALGLRVEHLLKVTAAQRSHQIARMASRNDPRAASWSTLIFSTNDMKEVMNTWRKDPATWMNPESFEKVIAMETRQEYHQACKKRFNTMLFELIGNKSLVETIIRFPICSAARPA
jgi:hypothetical protein